MARFIFPFDTFYSKVHSITHSSSFSFNQKNLTYFCFVRKIFYIRGKFIFKEREEQICQEKIPPDTSFLLFTLDNIKYCFGREANSSLVGVHSNSTSGFCRRPCTLSTLIFSKSESVNTDLCTSPSDTFAERIGSGFFLKFSFNASKVLLCLIAS